MKNFTRVIHRRVHAVDHPNRNRRARGNDDLFWLRTRWRRRRCRSNCWNGLRGSCRRRRRFSRSQRRCVLGHMRFLRRRRRFLRARLVRSRWLRRRYGRRQILWRLLGDKRSLDSHLVLDFFYTRSLADEFVSFQLRGDSRNCPGQRHLALRRFDLKIGSLQQGIRKELSLDIRDDRCIVLGTGTASRQRNPHHSNRPDRYSAQDPVPPPRTWPRCCRGPMHPVYYDALAAINAVPRADSRRSP